MKAAPKAAPKKAPKQIPTRERQARVALSRIGNALGARPKGSDSSAKIRLWQASYAGAQYRLAVAFEDEDPRAYLTMRGARDLARRIKRAIAALQIQQVAAAGRLPWCALCGADSAPDAEGTLCQDCDKNPACERCGAPAVVVAGGMIEDGREWGGWHLCGSCSALSPIMRGELRCQRPWEQAPEDRDP
jgi:hypothetical protein